MKKMITSVSIVASTLLGYQAKNINLFDPTDRYVLIGETPMIVGAQSLKTEGSENTVVFLRASQAKEMRAQLKAGTILAKDRKYHTQFGCTPTPKPAPIDEWPQEPVTGPESIPWGIKRVNASKLTTGQRGESVTVCVVDTGVDTDHPDLKDVVIGGKSYVNSSYEDDNGHGTHVAGTIAAKANSFGVRGVAQTAIYVVKALDAAGSGWSSAIGDGIDECRRRNSKVINLSLGSPRSGGEDPVINASIQRAINAGITVVAAAGNDSGRVGYPAASSGVVAIASSNQQDELSYFSSRGSEIDYIAPGSDILSTCVGGRYCTMSGTSMAAPHASALLAIGIANKNSLTTENLGLRPEHQGKGLLKVK